MNSYGDIIGLTSQALFSSMIWGVTYFIVLLAPLYIYMGNFLQKDKTTSGTIPFYETVGQAMATQIGALLIFAILGTFLNTISIGNSDLRPDKAFKVFFGSGDELIDERWSGYLSSLSTDTSNLTKFGNEAKGVAFLANKYIGITYKLFILFLFIAFIWFIMINLTKRYGEGELKWNIFERLYQVFVSTVLFVLVIGIHSETAKALPTFFGVPSTAVSVDFIKYFQKVIATIFYN